MKPEHAQALAAATLTLLRPLVRILLRNGLSVQSFFKLAKEVYVDIARDEFEIANKKSSISRVSILTGLTRKEVHRLLTRPQGSHATMTEQFNRATRVISGWVRDSRFSDGRGHPAPLPIEGSRGSFTDLVKGYSGDVPVRAILDELVRVGAVQRLKDGRICLRTRGYVPQQDPIEKLRILGSDTADLMVTIDHNLYGAPSSPRFQRKVMYDNVPTEQAKKFQEVAAAQGQECLEALDRWLSHRDRDVNPSVRGTGRVRCGVGIYHFEERLDSEP